MNGTSPEKTATVGISVYRPIKLTWRLFGFPTLTIDGPAGRQRYMRWRIDEM
jgi:hypothetical protein